MNSYTKAISPYVSNELRSAVIARQNGDSIEEFNYLERAHVLGQASTWHHVRVHALMFAWGLRNRASKEVMGQVVRMIGAATKTAIGLVPEGNTGGSNVSPFKKLPIAADLQSIIKSVSTAK